VGGTNPSLLEAMAAKALLVAHKNEFNQAILKENAFYFSNAKEVQKLRETVHKNRHEQIVQDNFRTIIQEFNWNKINESYLTLFKKSLQ
jgi:glycosyltransferase involved in cell wall biosynthesis